VLASRLASMIVVLSVFCLLPGCQPEDKITAAKHPRVNDMKRMLAAIVLPEKDGDEEKTWFFKVVGKETEIDPLVAPFHEFLGSVSFPTPDTPKWTLPAGWTQEKDTDKKFRYATILTGSKGKGLELTVSSLPGQASVPKNVIRWRLQLGLKDVLGTADLDDFCRYDEVANRLAVVVDITGPGGDAAAKMPPMPEREPARVPFKYQTPESWKEIPPTSRLYFLSFRVTEKGETAETHVALAGGSLAANVNRWREQLRVAPATKAEIDALPDVSIGVAKGKLVDVTGTDAPPQKNHIVGAIFFMGERSALFFKMMGPKDLVGRQKPAFESFLKSVILDE
jgi:hypothetical protein